VAEEAAAGAELADEPLGTGPLQRWPLVDTNAEVSFALEAAAEAREQGELWLTVALDTPVPVGLKSCDARSDHFEMRVGDGPRGRCVAAERAGPFVCRLNA